MDELFYNMDGVLADLAGCSKLTRLSFISGACNAPAQCSLGAGLAALAAGACVHSLVEVRLSGNFLGFKQGNAALHAAWLADAAELLKGGLVALRELSLQLPIDLPLPPQGGAEQRVGELLRQAGATVAFTVAEVKSTPYSCWCTLELGGGLKCSHGPCMVRGRVDPQEAWRLPSRWCGAWWR